MDATQPKQLAGRGTHATPGLPGAGEERDVSGIVSQRSGEDRGGTMQARLTAVQRALWWVPAASLAIAVLARPHPHNRQLQKALAEVTTFQAGFQRDALEKLLRDYAEAQAAVPLSEVVAVPTAEARGAARGQNRPPKLSVAADAAPLEPLSVIRLATLADARAHGGSDSAVDLGVPDVSGVGPALSWRLVHVGATGTPSVASVSLRPANVTQADVELEREAARLQTAKQAATSAVAAAAKRLEMEQNVFEARRKRGLPWKVILKSIEARDAAKQTLDERTQALADLQASYDDAVARALAPRPDVPVTGVPDFALAHVIFAPGAAVDAYDVPVPLAHRRVTVPPLRQAAFSATEAAGLWDKVKTLSPDQAVDAVRGEFNWHNRHLEVAGVKLSGAILLQLLPCVLPLLLLLLRARLRAAANSYSLFGTKVYGDMPKVGLQHRTLDALALVVLPVAACASAGISLVLIDQPPWLPGLAAVACLTLGGLVFAKVSELQGLVASVIHSHSYPPPQPQA
jgi:hypothetical protein